MVIINRQHCIKLGCYKSRKAAEAGEVKHKLSTMYMNKILYIRKKDKRWCLYVRTHKRMDNPNR